jgi:hypothetical protein
VEWQLTPWSPVLLEKPLIAQLFKNFPTFYRTRRFITMFTRVFHWSLSWARSIQSISLHLISLQSILILFSYLRLGLPRCLFPSGDVDTWWNRNRNLTHDYYPNMIALWDCCREEDMRLQSPEASWLHDALCAGVCAMLRTCAPTQRFNNQGPRATLADCWRLSRRDTKYGAMKYRIPEVLSSDLG